MAGKDPTDDERVTAIPTQESSPPSQRWGLVQEYTRTPGRRLMRALAKTRRARRQVMGPAGSPTIVPFIGYGSFRGEARIFARALEASAQQPPSVEDSVWTNFIRSYHQWRTQELPGTRVQISCGGSTVTVEADEEGYIDVQFSAPTLDCGWPRIAFQLRDQKSDSTTSIETKLMVPSPDVTMGIISDIDDTILQTHVQDITRMVALSVFGNALTRLGYDGTTRWLNGIVKKTGAPAFYVSRSAWNLFPLLRGFIQHQGLPLGPLVLRDVGLRRGAERRKGHKFRRMCEIFDMYPEMRFICIGDSGQRDAEIYAALSKRYPQRVVAIYIRDVGDPARRAVAEAACDQAAVPWLVFTQSEQAREHVERLGYWQEPDSR